MNKDKLYGALVWISIIILYGIAGTMDFNNLMGV
jgi:hypothetical protein